MSDSFEELEQPDPLSSIHRTIEGLSVVAVIVAIGLWQSDATLNAARQLFGRLQQPEASEALLAQQGHGSDIRLYPTPPASPSAAPSDVDTSIETASITPPAPVVPILRSRPAAPMVSSLPPALATDDDATGPAAFSPAAVAVVRSIPAPRTAETAQAAPRPAARNLIATAPMPAPVVLAKASAAEARAVLAPRSAAAEPVPVAVASIAVAAVPVAAPEPAAVAPRWMAACDTADGAFCTASQMLSLPGDPDIETSWTIERRPEGLYGVWTVPTAVLVTRGMALIMGEGPPKTVPFTSCGSHSCEVRARLAGDFIDLLRRSSRVSTEIVLKDGTTAHFDFTRDGLDTALEKLGV